MHDDTMPHFRERPTLRAQKLRNEATPAERKLWSQLSRSQLGQKFSRQMPIGPFIADFLCRSHRLVIEIDGGQHCESASDPSRTRFIESQGFRVIRFWNNEVMGNLEGVIIRITEALALSPPPTPSRKREGNQAPLPLAGGEEARSAEGEGRSTASTSPPPLASRADPSRSGGRGNTT